MQNHADYFKVAYEYKYLDLVGRIIKDGYYSKGRLDKTTGEHASTRRLFGQTLDINLKDNFPILTTKKMDPFNAFVELEWFLSGRQDPGILKDQGIKYWDPWLDKDPSIGRGIGRGYGVQLRQWCSPSYTLHEESHYYEDLAPSLEDVNYVDQVQVLINEIKANPDSRRLLLTYWNPGELALTALPPCITIIQFFVNEGKLDMCVYQRSADVMLGLPFDIANNAMLAYLVANSCGLVPNRMTYITGDTHIYEKHIPQAKIQIAREPIVQNIIPRIGGMDVDTFKARSVEFVNALVQHPAIKFDVAV